MDKGLEVEVLFKGHPNFEEFINAWIVLSQLRRELVELETTMNDSEMFRMSADEQEIEQAKTKRIAFRERRQFLRMDILEQRVTVQVVTKNYLESIVGILRNRPVAEYRKFINICSDSLNHEAIGETEMEEFTKDVWFAFAGKE